MSSSKSRLLYPTDRVALPLDRRAVLRAIGFGALWSLARIDEVTGSDAARQSAASPDGQRAQRGSGKPGELWREADAIARRIVPPRFPSRVFDITRFGARPDGTTDSSAALRDAIARCHAAGGGQVLVPAGRFLTGPVVLRSNVNLHLADE